MKAYFTIDKNNLLEVDMWPDYLSEKTFRETVEFMPMYTDKYGKKKSLLPSPIKRTIFKDENGIYFIWDDRHFYLNAFDYLPIDALITKIQTGIDNRDRWYVGDDEIWATLIRDTDNIGIVLDMPAYDAVYPTLGIGLVGNNKYSVLCIPTEKHYKKEDWLYKFTVECESEELRRYIPSEDFYFEDFCSLIKQGYFKLVKKDDFKKDGVVMPFTVKN